MAKHKIVVVDGSNLATEGRSTPSLVQLDQSVKAFVAENPGVDVIVVVDATFEHRVAKEERARFKEAELAGEVVTPPAGAVGRGDAFILKIAARADAVVLSNDSFQEFHAEHPWLFDEGRLIGGKPVAGVGWIFTPRNPVRGPKSRAVRSRAAALEANEDAVPTKLGDVRAGAAKKRAARSRPKDADATAPVATARAAGRSPSRAKSATPEAAPKKKAVKAAAAPRSATTATKAAKAPQKSAPGAKRAAATTTAKSDGATKRAVAAAKRRAPTRSASAAPPERASTPGRSKRAELGPANTPKAFGALVASHPLRSTVEGEVTTFTSHGAMVTISVGRGMRVVCYAPLARLGKPAPTRVRDVLKKGERRSFRIAAFDEERRIAELGLV